MIAAVGTVLAKHGLNISFMTVTRMGRGQDAVMALGIDSQPSQVLDKQQLCPIVCMMSERCAELVCQPAAALLLTCVFTDLTCLAGRAEGDLGY